MVKKRQSTMDCPHKKMLDLIINRDKLTLNVSSYLQEYMQYPVNYTYNTVSEYYTMYEDPQCSKLFDCRLAGL